MNPSRLLPLLAIVALLLLLIAAAMLAVGQGASALGAHIAFALGVMPLILAAMSYFVPVLTRGPGAATASWLPPSWPWAAVVWLSRRLPPTIPIL